MKMIKYLKPNGEDGPRARGPRLLVAQMRLKSL